MSEAMAAGAGYIRCGSCERVCRVPPLPADARAHCPRCGAVLAGRKPHSLARTWALVIAAAICYVPANVLPVMVVAGPGGSQADTILSGVQAMFQAGWTFEKTLAAFQRPDWLIGDRFRDLWAREGWKRARDYLIRTVRKASRGTQ